MTDDRLTTLDVCRRFRWTIADLRQARLLGFPTPDDRRTTAGTIEPVWSPQLIAKWQRALVALGVHKTRP